MHLVAHYTAWFQPQIHGLIRLIDVDDVLENRLRKNEVDGVLLYYLGIAPRYPVRKSNRAGLLCVRVPKHLPDTLDSLWCERCRQTLIGEDLTREELTIQQMIKIRPTLGGSRRAPPQQVREFVQHFQVLRWIGMRDDVQTVKAVGAAQQRCDAETKSVTGTKLGDRFDRTVDSV